MPIYFNHYFRHKLLEYISNNLGTRRKPKYNNEYILDIIWKINSTGICWNSVDSICHYTTAYKRFIFWTNNNVFKLTYEQIRDEYIKKQTYHNYKNLYIDTMTIKNRKGVECIGRCKKIKFKNGNKISLIVDEILMPVGLYITSGNIHDSKTISNTLDSINLSLIDKRIKINLMADKYYKL